MLNITLCSHRGGAKRYLELVVYSPAAIVAVVSVAVAIAAAENVHRKLMKKMYA